MFDWKIGIFVLQCFTTIVTVLGFIVIKFNDLKHLSLDFIKINKKLDKLDEDVKDLSNRVTAVEVKISCKK